MNNQDRPDSLPNDDAHQMDADRIVAAMESDSAVPPSKSQLEKEAQLLGNAIRNSATTELPPRNEALHAQMLTALGSDEPMVETSRPVKTPDHASSFSWPLVLTIAATLLLMGFVGWSLWSGQTFYQESRYTELSLEHEVYDYDESQKPAEEFDSVKKEPNSNTKSGGPPVADLRFQGDHGGFGSPSANIGNPSNSTASKDSGLYTEGRPTNNHPFPNSTGKGKGLTNTGGDGLGENGQWKRSDGQTRGEVSSGGVGGKNLSEYGDPVAPSSSPSFTSPRESAEIPELERFSPTTRHPGRYERHRTSGSEQYDSINENPFIAAQGMKAVSTFSIDVDTASYTNMRRFINRGQRVPRNAVRIEEFVNYFDYDYPQPKENEPFSVNMELASCPWNQRNKLLRVGLQGKEIHRDERPASNLVFLIDVSGSMGSADKLPLLKSGFRLMVDRLNENDMVSIVTYAGSSKVVLQPTSGDQKRTIINAINNLRSGGSTNGSAGISTAYNLAQQNLIPEGSNRVILATDGDLNVGITSDNDLVNLIKGKASEGVFLTVLGFGTGNLKDSKMEKIADNGNGIYAYIDGLREAHRVLVEGMSGSLVTIAKDVKIQIEFNPSAVKSYRLIGYENRLLAAKDFDDDTKDAGEIGAGHTVTALYELVTSDTPSVDVAPTQKLKYQPQEPTAEDLESGKKTADNDELLTLALRFKQPDSDESERIEYTLANKDTSFTSASRDFRFAASVASFGMILRGSQHRGSATLQWVADTAAGALGEDTSGFRSEFIDLVRRCSSAR